MTGHGVVLCRVPVAGCLGVLVVCRWYINLERPNEVFPDV